MDILVSGSDQKTEIVSRSLRESPAPRDEPRSALRREGAPLLAMWVRGTQAEMGAQHGRLVREAGGYEEIIEYYHG